MQFNVIGESNRFEGGPAENARIDPVMKLKDLAQDLGLSPTTVSRALNGYPEVSETTRARVLAAARKHGYSPNTRAQALATGRAMAIGHVISVETRDEMMNPVFSGFIAGASEVYATEGYTLLLTVIPADAGREAYRDYALRGAVDGIVVHAPRADDARIAALQGSGLPFVVHGRAGGDTDGYNWVDVNNRGAFRRATEHLADLGHRRIALVNGLETMNFAIRRRTGYLDGIEARGLTADPGLMLSGEMTESYGYDAARALISRPKPPTAILASSTIIAFGVRRALDEAGLVLGRDVSLIAYDDDLSYFRNGGQSPLFTALRSSVREAGRRAAELVLDQIRAPGPPRHLLLEADFILGRSTGPVRQPARTALS